MKTYRRARTLLLSLALLVAVGAAWAQTSERVWVSTDNPEEDRRVLIEKNLGLTEAEATAFWPVYAAYRKEMSEVDDKRVKLIQSFAESYQHLTDDKASEMLDSYFEFRKAKVALQTSYIPRFEAAVPAKKVARYYQIENLIDTMVDFDLTRAIPLIK